VATSPKSLIDEVPSGYAYPHRWLTGDKKLPKKTRRLIELLDEKEQSLLVSAASLWEIAKLAERGRIRLRTTIRSFLHAIEDSELFEIVGIDAEIAATSIELGSKVPKDPALCGGCILVTEDQLITDSDSVATY
jgi:PIN domain nuclease of toxin-antitoxin system